MQQPSHSVKPRDKEVFVVGVSIVSLFALVFLVTSQLPSHPSTSTISSTNTDFSTPIMTSPLKTSTSSSKPHIVFILADDLGWNSIGYEDYDLNFVSPYLTSLAASGMTLSNYYAQEVCTPSRAAMLTGRYPLTLGMQYGVVQPSEPWGLNLSETTLVEVLSDEGYDTYMLGKWHLGHHTPRYLPTARGFDTFLGYVNGDNYYFSKRNPLWTNFHDFMSANTTCFDGYSSSDMHSYSTILYKDKAIEIIESQDPDTPMFLYLAFQAVHNPFDDLDQFASGVPKEFVDAEIYDKITDTVVVSAVSE